MTERPRREDLVRSRVSKAEHDLLNIENNLAAKEIPMDTVGFHAKQCGEKYLKALLVFHRVNFPKIASGVILVNEIGRLMLRV